MRFGSDPVGDFIDAFCDGERTYVPGPTGLETEIRRTVGLARARWVSDLVGEDGRVRQP